MRRKTSNRRKILRQLCERKGVKIIEAEGVLRSYTYANRNAAGNSGFKLHGVSQGEKCDGDIRWTQQPQV